MTVRIVTDSTADIPPDVARELGITAVPLYVLLDDRVRRDRVDISEEEIYRRLAVGASIPTTTQPTPVDFADVYQRLSAEADGIVSLHISSKLSGTCSSATRGREMIVRKCPIEVVDSQTVTVGLGLLVVAAARLAAKGKGFAEVAAAVRQMMPTIDLLCLVDTLEYLARGGRLGRGRALMGSILGVKPLLSVKEGVVVPVGRARTRTKGLDWLFDFVCRFDDIQDVIIAYSTTPQEAHELADRIAPMFPRQRIMVTGLGCVLGAHCGPGTIFVGVRGKEAPR